MASSLQQKLRAGAGVWTAAALYDDDDDDAQERYSTTAALLDACVILHEDIATKFTSVCWRNL